MERKLLMALVLVLSLAMSAQAQVRLIIDSPASIAGAITPIGLPAKDVSWGFDRDTTGPVTAPVQCVLGIDSFACSALPAGSLTGKIALIHRGPDPALGVGQPCGFGKKALNCQNAGAVGVLMVYEPRGTQGESDLPSEISGTNGADVSGASVRIPIVMVDRPTGRRIKRLLCDSGVVTMGGFLGYYPYNLTFDKTTEAVSPKAASYPISLISGAGDYAFTPNIFFHNVGNQNQTNVVAHAYVHRFYDPSNPSAAPYDVYHDSIVIPLVEKAGAPGDTGEATFAEFDIWNAVPSGDRTGIYELEYRIISPNGDADFSDNTIKYGFRITDRYHSLAQLDPITNELPAFKPVSPVLSTPSNRNYKLGSIFETPNFGAGETRVLDSVRLAVGVGTDTVDITTVQITLDVSKWDDTDDDGTISDAELTQVGSGLLAFNSNADNGKYFTVAIDDAATGNPGPISLDRNSTYIVIAGYQGDDIATFSGVYDDYSYFRLFSRIPGLISPFFLDTWRVGFRDAWAAYRVGILNPTSTKPNVNQIALTLQPNPAREYVEVKLEKATGTVTVQVLDMQGRVLKTTTSAGTPAIRMSTSDLSNGLYQMVVRSEEGITVRKFAVSK